MKQRDLIAALLGIGTALIVTLGFVTLAQVAMLAGG